MAREAGGAAIADHELEELLKRAKGDTPELEPAGQCPYCQRNLEKREIVLPVVMFKFLQSFDKNRELFRFWACTNENCCLMFWRHPRIAVLPNEH